MNKVSKCQTKIIIIDKKQVRKQRDGSKFWTPKHSNTAKLTNEQKCALFDQTETITV